MFYPKFTSDHKTISYIEYYRELRAKYGDRYFEFDPEAIKTASKLAKKDQQFREDMQKAEQMPAPDRCQVTSIRFPASCGIQFSRMMATQVQKQIEDRIGITNIHRIPSVTTTLRPFPTERDCFSDDMLKITEYEDGMCYLYFQVGISAIENTMGNRLYRMEPVHIWVRCYDEDNPCRKVDVMDETATRLRFEEPLGGITN